MSIEMLPLEEAQGAWQSVLKQLQMEMPRASFDTWVCDTQVVSFDRNVITIGARNVYARDWLESRLTGTVSRLLLGIMNRPVDVRFAVMGVDGEDGLEVESEEEVESETREDEEDLALEPVGWLDYDRIVQPHRQVVVKGYLRRLAWRSDQKPSGCTSAFTRQPGCRAPRAEAIACVAAR